MKSFYLIVSIILFSGFSIKAEEKVHERVYIHTDKDCYIAGEEILLKFYLINNNFQPSAVSKVGYVEICDTGRPQMQMKVALEKGHGAGKIQIPRDMPSGVYLLSAYTRYMRNEGEKVFFNKQIVIVNVENQVSDSKRFEVIEESENTGAKEKALQELKEPANLVIKTDRSNYGNRSKVLLLLDNIPDNTTDLIVSVSRNDSIAFVPGVNRQEWLKQVKDTIKLSHQWVPEYEGHIFSGRIVPETHDKQYVTNISFVGKDLRYFTGQLDSQNCTANFYTAGVYGRQQIVTSVISTIYDKVPFRVDLISPFCESLPDNLPLLQIYPNEKQFLDRYIGIQVRDRMDNDSLNNSFYHPIYSTLQPVKTYNLDEYTRFETISETILEFVTRLRVSKLRDHRVIGAYLEESKQFSLRTLVLLDGIPIYNHDDILQYNPMYIRMLDIYDGRFMFGNENYEGIISFVTREGDLPFFTLSEGSQLLSYECPQLYTPLEIPDYSSNEIMNSRKPDFRHTLYWNPFVEITKGQPINLSFYTSDLSGEFKVTVEGVTTDGKTIQGNSYFQVN